MCINIRTQGLSYLFLVDKENVQIINSDTSDMQAQSITEMEKI